MLVFFENYPYPKGTIKKYLDGSIPVVFEDGYYKVNHIGYLFISTDEYSGPVFILPKLFLQKENSSSGAKDTLLGYSGLYPEKIFNIVSQQNPLVKNGLDAFLPELSLWLYRSLSRYLYEINKEDDEAAKKELFHVSPQDGSYERDFLSTVIRLIDFLSAHRNLFTQISIINHSGKSAVNWHKTLSKDPYFADNKPYYLDLQVKGKIINIDEELIVLYYSVLRYLRDKFKFPIQLGDISYNLISSSEVQRYLDTGLGERLLRNIKGKYFRDDLKYLWELLYSFFSFNTTSEDKKPRKEALVVKNFERVFERMVDQLIGDTQELAELKKQSDGKLIDHIYRDKSLIGTGADIYYIGDSKYYSDNNDVKGVALYKQFTYAKNTIQYNIERINLQGMRTLDKLRYRDEETEGYNITPNFFIRPRVQPKNLQCDDPSLRWSGNDIQPNKQFEDRLFDRDTLLLREYDINLLFIIAAYGAYEDWAKSLRSSIREDMIRFLNEKYIFFEIVPLPIPITSNGKQVAEIPFLDYHRSRLRGKIYKPTDDSNTHILAYERDTAIGQADLEDAINNLSSSVAGESLGDEKPLKP